MRSWGGCQSRCRPSASRRWGCPPHAVSIGSCGPKYPQSQPAYAGRETTYALVQSRQLTQGSARDAPVACLYRLPGLMQSDSEVVADGLKNGSELRTEQDQSTNYHDNDKQHDEGVLK